MGNSGFVFLFNWEFRFGRRTRRPRNRRRL